MVRMKIGEFFKKNWIRMLIAFGVGLLFMVFYNILYASAGANAWTGLEYYRDGSFMAFLVLLAVGGLAAVGSTGFFDIFSFYPGRKKKEDGTKENYAEYVQRKNEGRAKLNLSFLSYFIIALIYAIFSLVLFFVLM